MSACFKVSFFLVLLLVQWCGVENKYCGVAVESVVEVDACPTTKKEWDNAAELKNCRRLATRQNCSPIIDRFKYHCVINSFRNRTLEVCAPEKTILGHCTEFNVHGGVIQLHETAPCNNSGFPQCDKYYSSSEAYKYQDCYRLVNRTRSKPPKHETSEIGVLPIILPVVIGIILVVFIGIVLYRKLYRGRNFSRKSHTETMELELELEGLISQPTGLSSDPTTDPSPKVIDTKSSIGPTKTSETRKPSSKVAKEFDRAPVPDSVSKFGFAVDKNIEDYKEENIELSRRYLKYHKTINKYFVQTETYQKGEKIFDRYGIVVLTGQPGCGKTLAAIHLILNHMDIKADWSFRKIRSWDELSYIDTKGKSLIFIDNIFYQQALDSDLEDWWTGLKNLHNNFFQSKENENGSNCLRIIITARKNDIERVCTYMGERTPILNQNYWVDLDTLTGNEKIEILEKQIDFAEIEKGITIPKMDGEFLDKVRVSHGPIGFPFCAHLFVCSDEYQESGVHFFSHPIRFLKKQIKDEMMSDKSNRTKSIFFVLFFHEWHAKSKPVEILNIDNENKCKQFLHRISPDLCKHFEPFDFKNLEIEVQRLVGTFLQHESDSVYKFIHDSVYEAVGSLLCEEYVANSAKYFPLDVIYNQEYENVTEDEAAILVSRLLYETLHQRHSEVFACRVFHRASFVDLFISILKKKEDKTIEMFFAVTNDASTVKLPCMFWTSCKKLARLTDKLYDIVMEKNINIDYHFYVSLYGECCATNERMLKTLNGMLRDNLEEIKQRVLDFKDAEHGNTILHLLISSERSDRFIAVAIEKLLQDGINVDLRNKKKLTPLMFAVDQPYSRKEVIEKLKSFKIHHQDHQNRTALHHCVASSHNDDNTCAEYLEIILSCKDVEKILSKNDAEGNTVLSIAAMETKYSRIMSIAKLLESDSKVMIKTVNNDGFSPLELSVQSLKGDSAYMQLECCVRVILLLSYGGKADNKPDTDYDAIADCEFDLIQNILKNPKDTPSMIGALKSLLEKCPETKIKTPGKSTLLLDSSLHINRELQALIINATEVLKNFCFENKKK
uniref:Uncharacterized protein LOC111105635 n=1 Tax=Crassostrea virginica TaxID=6565 RepID=A0A8B8AX25_CRAVI|nr:uncharacterized protein LOC111105635 [Crassostrea virginica]XP_022295719.1 uncharacterized protein LOC111105635 [Crassostrea virginica]XP_022295720.1 uncharacterized protein LOC111105635 [Crassostrea virginica]XP_022295721.1 uncharacterized protein LOC111105635 [Crassostrea virginica]XP_022295722.1 uncharacterized protein LOC111105635 [Crassostrea virginica]